VTPRLVSVVAELPGPGLRVAGQAGLGLADGEIDGHRQLDADRLALVARPVQVIPSLIFWAVSPS
jgi:hypothetical protein